MDVVGMMLGCRVRMVITPNLSFCFFFLAGIRSSMYVCIYVHAVEDGCRLRHDEKRKRIHLMQIDESSMSTYLPWAVRLEYTTA